MGGMGGGVGSQEAMGENLDDCLEVCDTKKIRCVTEPDVADKAMFKT